MNEIKNVLICGLGAIGSIFADTLKNSNLKVLVDPVRYERYLSEPLVFNGEPLDLSYILPDEKSFKADFILIVTKYDGLFDAIKNIENFVHGETLIMSLLNGVTSEDIIADKYGAERVIPAYFIGHSAVRNGRNVVQDGVYKIIFGSDYSDKIKILKTFFDKTGINYEVSDDIVHSMWAKFMLNVSANQITAIKGQNFGEFLADAESMSLALAVMKEVESIAKAKGVSNYNLLTDETLQSLKKMIPDGKTSMLQDIEAGRKTEVDMFAGVIIDYGKKFGIKTPLNEMLKTKIHAIERKNISQFRLQ